LACLPMIYTFYIFDRHGTCLYYEEWNRKGSTLSPQEEQKLMYGLLWSLKSFSLKSSPNPDQEKSGFHYYKTNAYKLHFFETASNIKFVITSDPDCIDLRDTLKNIYKNIFVEYVVKNPLQKLSEPIKCELFTENLQKEIKSLPAFRMASSLVPSIQKSTIH
jgi:hypothetical protein